MSDMETYLNRCYSLLFGAPQQAPEEELCACAKMVHHDEQQPKGD